MSIKSQSSNVNASFQSSIARLIAIVSQTHKEEKFQKGVDRNMRVRQILLSQSWGWKGRGPFSRLGFPSGEEFCLPCRPLPGPWPPLSLANGRKRICTCQKPFPGTTILQEVKKQTNKKATLSEATGAYLHLNLCGGKASSRLVQPFCLMWPIKQDFCETFPLLKQLPEDTAEEMRLTK